MARTPGKTASIQPALDAFQHLTGIQAEFLPGSPDSTELFRDGQIRLYGLEIDVSLNVEIRESINDSILGRIALQIRNHPKGYILVANYVPPFLAKRMKELQIQFIDSAGNGYLNIPPVIVCVIGNKPDSRVAIPTADRLFSVGGIRIIFSLLCKPSLLNTSFREIATTAGVSLGTTAGVMKNLTDQNHLAEIPGRGRTLLKKKELAEKWTDAYNSKLRSKQLMGRYSTSKALFWKDEQINLENALWGGEVAAYKLIPYVKPEVITLYANRPVDDLIRALKLRKDEKGPIELRERFWQFDDPDNSPIVPPLLVYADLLAIGDPRTIDVATLIYNEHLNKQFL